MANKGEGNFCHACGRRLEGIKVFEGFMARMFLDALSLSGKHEIVIEGARTAVDGIVFIKDVGTKLGPSQYSRFADLRYWGLVASREKDSRPGVYQITESARNFVHGNARIPQSVVVAKGSVLRYSPEEITLKEALGSDWITREEWILNWCRLDRPEDQMELRFQ